MLNNRLQHVRILIYSLMLSLMTASIIIADEYKTPHRFQGGDIISADMMNEIFEQLEYLNKIFTLSDIVGTWECEKVIVGNSEDASVYSYAYTPIDDHMNFWTHTITLNIVDNDGTYSWSSSPTNGIMVTGENIDNCKGESDRIQMYKGRTIMIHTLCSDPLSTVPIEVSIIRKSTTQFKMIQTGQSNGFYPNLFCDKQNIPPEKPDSLALTPNGKKVTLTWIRMSDDEIGFNILRKNSTNGDYVVIDSTPANTKQYTDTIPDGGKYWYRVESFNDYGSSLGSNVVAVSIDQ